MKITNLLENTTASMPDPGQKSFRSGRSETSLEEMTAGSVASVPMPMGKVIKRESGIAQGIKKKMVDEGELSEADLIMVPGQMSKRSKGFVSKDRNEMERIEMAKSDVVQSVKSATAIFSILKNSDDEIEGWVQEKLAKAEDYLDTVREYLEGKSMPAEGMSAGVRMQRALQREKEKREYSERFAEKHFPIGKKPEPIKEPSKEVKEGDQDWMKDVIAMAHKMAPQDKMRERQAQRDAQAKAERQQRIQQDIENLPDLISQYNDMEAEYESMGGKNWQYADREQNLSDEERKARGMETSMRQLADRIHIAKKASEGLAESKPDFAKMFNKKIDKHNKAVVKTKKEIGTRVADIGAGGKEYNVKTDKEWDKQEGVAEGLFGIDDKIKGRIQNVVSDLSDIPGMWDHKAQTFTDAGMEKLKSVLKNNPKYIKYALNLNYKDYEADLSEQKLDEACWKGYHKEGNKKMFGKTYPNCVKNTNEEQEQLDEKCWDTHKQVGMKSKGGKQVPNCVPKESVEESHNENCPECGGPMFSDLILAEKQDACYSKVKSRYKVWPSAYASGALVQCRKKGAANWGNKSESMTLEELEESLHDWFNKEKWVRMDTKGKIKGPCAREPGEGKPKCLPQSKAHNLGKKGRASAASRKRREDPNPERSGKAINVNTKKSNEGLAE